MYSFGNKKKQEEEDVSESQDRVPSFLELTQKCNVERNAGTAGLDCGASWKEKQGGQRTANQEELASIQEEAERTVTWSEAVNTNMRVEGVNLGRPPPAIPLWLGVVDAARKSKSASEEGTQHNNGLARDPAHDAKVFVNISRCRPRRTTGHHAQEQHSQHQAHFSRSTSKRRRFLMEKCA